MYPDLSQGDAHASTQKAPIESAPFRPPFSLRASSTPRAGTPSSQAVGAPPRDSLPFFQVGLSPHSDSIIFLDMMENEASANTISQKEISNHTPTHLYSEIHS